MSRRGDYRVPAPNSISLAPRLRSGNASRASSRWGDVRRCDALPSLRLAHGANRSLPSPVGIGGGDHDIELSFPTVQGRDRGGTHEVGRSPWELNVDVSCDQRAAVYEHRLGPVW